MVRTVAERALTRHGYKVLTANNGEEALEIVAQGEEIALLISDVVMPRLTGLETSSRFRAISMLNVPRSKPQLSSSGSRKWVHCSADT